MIDETPRDVAARARLGQAFTRAVPHNVALGIDLLDFAPSTGVLLRLPYGKELIGNPDTAVVGGGAITSLLDASCGVAVFLALLPPRPIATLDLRIDYLGPAVPERDVMCRAHCTKVTRHVAFATAIAFHADETRPVATAAATFMVFRTAENTPGGTAE